MCLATQWSKVHISLPRYSRAAVATSTRRPLAMNGIQCTPEMLGFWGSGAFFSELNANPAQPMDKGTRIVRTYGS